MSRDTRDWQKDMEEALYDFDVYRAVQADTDKLEKHIYWLQQYANMKDSKQTYRKVAQKYSRKYRAEKERADRVTEERARFNQVYEMLLKKFNAAEEREQKLKEAIDKCLTAGNSLASVIMSYELPNGHENWTKEDAISYFYEEHGRDIAYEHYETWLAWKSIKDVSTSLYLLDKEEDA